MLLQCPKSCSVCHVLDIQALIDQKLAPDIDATELGVPQIVDQDRALEVEARVQNITNYFQTIVKVQDEYQKVRKECKNRHESCAYWAVLGEVRVAIILCTFSFHITNDTHTYTHTAKNIYYFYYSAVRSEP